MIRADMDRYGGIKTDRKPVFDPTTEMSAADDMRRSCDLAQLTRTGAKVWIRFETRGTNGTLTISARSTVWGDTNTYDPTTATRTAAGIYTLTWPASFNDELSEAETVSFVAGRANIADSGDFGFSNVVVSGNSATVYLANTAGAASDLTAGTLIDLWLY